jgi:glycosyltransferase involved in cell wall biosynthesis
MPDMPDLPRVTLVVTQRERMSLTERSLESILDDLSEPFRLIYVSAGAPDDVNTYLDRRQKEVGFTLIRHPEWMWPNTARNLACATIDTPYVVFIDNDVLVEPGWLKKLVACADETGAALVGPLYLWSDDKVEPRMTMADTPAGKTLHERHDDINAPLSHRAHLKRAPCDFLEYHCMLVRIDFLHSIGGLSETIVCVHEHIDMALAAKKAGKTVWMEPTSAITYLAFVPYQLSDLAFYCWRWGPQAAEKSIRAFCKKWELADDAAAFSGVRNFVHKHVTAIDPFLPNAPTAKPTATMTAQDIKQHLYGLLTQAAAQGYDNAALESISTAYTAAMTLFAGGFRPCARSFIAHCTGTASALVAFGFAPHVVIAGMLHAAYSHTPLGPEPTATLENLANCAPSSANASNASSLPTRIFRPIRKHGALHTR